MKYKKQLKIQFEKINKCTTCNKPLKDNYSFCDKCEDLWREKELKQVTT